MFHPPKSKPIAYPEVVRMLNDQDVQEDINDACGKLAQVMSAMMDKFDSIAKQMHTVDLLRLSTPLKPKWDSMRKDLADLLWQFRTNSNVISGRLKLFCTAVLPMVARNIDVRSARSPYHTECLQVLQSYMSISAEHAALTGSLVERVFRLSADLVSFVSEFTKLTSRHAVSGQKEMCDLSQRLSELEAQIQHIFQTSSEASTTEVAHLLFTTSRMVLSSGRAAGQSKITRRQIILDGDLTNIGRAYEHTDRKRNEVAYAQYAAQLRQSRTDPLATAQTMLSAFLLDELLTSESGLSLFLSIWSRLRIDCTDIFHWLKNPAHSTPKVISCYTENHCTLYAPLATALDVYATGVDPALYASERRGSP